VAQISETEVAEAMVVNVPDDLFVEGYVEADRFRIRYCEAGQGDALICLHGAGGLRLSPAHVLLAKHYRVIAFEVPGFGHSPVNERSQSLAELANTMAQAAMALGLERFDLMGNSFGGALALWLAVQYPERVQALVLVAPAAMRPETSAPPRSLSPEARMARLYAHPERQLPAPPMDPAMLQKQQALVQRVMGPPRDEALERRMTGLDLPVLVVFGTEDRMIPSDMGRLYCEKLPNCHLILVYDAGHSVDADRPEAFVSVVGDFLQRHDAFLVNRQSGLIHP
jgi:pimeloyl-ACP methyl ester carboxylesterase